jgi:uncharacterized protein YqgC (DUF456 family)
MKMKKHYLAAILITISLWLIQSLAMYSMSKQYREIGYIRYGSLREIGSFIPQLGIIFVPFFGCVLLFLIQMKMFFKSFQMLEDRIPFSFVLVVLFIIISARTALIAIQGYALIFI